MFGFQRAKGVSLLVNISKIQQGDRKGRPYEGDYFVLRKKRLIWFYRKNLILFLVLTSIVL
jgi:hypothetical protein